MPAYMSTGKQALRKFEADDAVGKRFGSAASNIRLPHMLSSATTTGQLLRLIGQTGPTLRFDRPSSIVCCKRAKGLTFPGGTRSTHRVRAHDCEIEHPKTAVSFPRNGRPVRTCAAGLHGPRLNFHVNGRNRSLAGSLPGPHRSAGHSFGSGAQPYARTSTRFDGGWVHRTSDRPSMGGTIRGDIYSCYQSKYGFVMPIKRQMVYIIIAHLI